MNSNQADEPQSAVERVINSISVFAPITPAVIAEARAELTALRRRVETAEAERDAAFLSEEAADQRAGYKGCACMYDRPDDVCMVHSPAVEKCKRRAETAEAALIEVRDCITPTRRGSLIRARSILNQAMHTTTTETPL